MPYTSKAQQAFFHANPDKVGGAAEVHKWDQATKHKKGGFKSLPKRKKK